MPPPPGGVESKERTLSVSVRALAGPAAGPLLDGRTTGPRTATGISLLDAGEKASTITETLTHKRSGIPRHTSGADF
jgi:hypothetical protein